jgi:NTE family protein
VEKEFKIGIVLGGGGTRGFAHLGVLEALFERGIRPDIISSVSSGSLVGVLLADGKTPQEIFGFLKAKKMMDFSSIHFPINGLLSLDGLKKDLQKHLSVNFLEDLKIPLVVGATNLNTGQPRYFERGEIGDIILASSSIPVLFSPIEIEGYLYSDGGIYDNLPVTPIRDRCEKIIAINVSPVQETMDLSNLIKIAARVFQLSVNSNIHKTKAKCDIFIEPEGMDKYDILDSSHAEELFTKGYDFAKRIEIKID